MGHILNVSILLYVPNARLFLESLYDSWSYRYWAPHPVFGNIVVTPKKAYPMLHIRALFVRTQFTFRQRRLSLGRCEHKLDTPCPLHTDHLLPTCNYDRFHRTLKSVARSWQYVCCTRVACRSRSAIVDLISRCRRVIQN